MFEATSAGGPVVLPPLAIFTDFDGTLVDLAEAPDAIEVPPELIAEIEDAARRLDGAVAIITGRALDDLDNYLPASIPAAGGHGIERRRADGSRIGASAEQKEAAREIASRLQAFAEDKPGLIVEPKTASVALHYRLAPNLRGFCLDAMGEALRQAGDFMMLEGKMVLEARPASAGKGAALRAFMHEPPFRGRVPVFFGDDTTDEEGFAAARELGGVGVKVGDGETVAQVRAESVEAARAILQRLAAAATKPNGHILT
jgi:trehalose 6-phosphate phosphatase